MARPREFDEDAVLAIATQRFWMNGYEATSIRDLAAATGLTSASLYNAFGDKRRLYRLVLDRYAASALEACEAAFSDQPPLEALEGFFELVVREAMTDPQRKGCLIVNTAVELAPHDRDFQEAVAAVLTGIGERLRGCIQAGQADGTIATRQPAEDLARLCLGALLGLRVLARGAPAPDMLAGLVRPLLVMLRTPPSAASPE